MSHLDLLKALIIGLIILFIGLMIIKGFGQKQFNLLDTIKSIWSR